MLITIIIFIVAGIVVDGFPPLKSLKPIGSCSSASQSNHSELENKMVSNFTTLFTNQQLKDQVQSSSTLWVDYPDGIPYWSSESDIKGFVQRGLQCLSKEIGLTDIIFLSGVSLFDQADNTDILVVSLLGVPIGVIEVKRPQWRNETSPTDDLRCLGQLFDYVHHLRAYSGRQHAFGILTTYHEWRIVWLSDNDDVAHSNTLLPTNQSETSVSVFPQDIPNWSSSNNFPPTQSDVHPQKLSRELCVSDIYLYNDANLPNVLVSVLKKMKNSPLILPNPSKLVKQWPYIYLSSGSMEWHRPSTDTQLQIEGRAPEFFQTVYLLADLGGGGDGRVWLATTPNGKVCVLKFSLDKQSLDQECEIWNKLWPFTKVSVKKLWDKHVLVMPWAKPCSQEELNDPKIFGLVKKNLKRLTEAGLKHDDMKLSLLVFIRMQILNWTLFFSILLVFLRLILQVVMPHLH